MSVIESTKVLLISDDDESSHDLALIMNFLGEAAIACNSESWQSAIQHANSYPGEISLALIGDCRGIEIKALLSNLYEWDSGLPLVMLGKSRLNEIPDEQVIVTLTSGGYVKRTADIEYRKQGRGGKGKRGMVTKEEDIIEHLVYASTHEYLLFFTNRGRVFRIKTYEIPNAGLNARGIAIVNLLQLQPEEEVN